MISRILSLFLGWHLLRSRSGIETVAGDPILKKKREGFSWGLGVATRGYRDGIVPVYLISETRTAVGGKILIKPCQDCSHIPVWSLHVL